MIIMMILIGDDDDEDEDEDDDENEDEDNNDDDDNNNINNTTNNKNNNNTHLPTVHNCLRNFNFLCEDKSEQHSLYFSYLNFLFCRTTISHATSGKFSKTTYLIPEKKRSQK